MKKILLYSMEFAVIILIMFMSFRDVLVMQHLYQKILSGGLFLFSTLILYFKIKLYNKAK